jgi:hypothetical protein
VQKSLIFLLILISFFTSTNANAQLGEDQDTDLVLKQAIQACEENSERNLVIRPYDMFPGFYVRTTITCGSNKPGTTRILDVKRNPKISQSILGLRTNHFGNIIKFSGEGVDVRVNYQTK